MEDIDASLVTALPPDFRLANWPYAWEENVWLPVWLVRRFPYSPDKSLWKELVLGGYQKRAVRAS